MPAVLVAGLMGFAPETGDLRSVAGVRGPVSAQCPEPAGNRAIHTRPRVRLTLAIVSVRIKRIPIGGAPVPVAGDGNSQIAGLCDTSMPMPFPKDVTPASREELRLSVVGTDAARAVRDGSYFVT